MVRKISYYIEYRCSCFFFYYVFWLVFSFRIIQTDPNVEYQILINSNFVYVAARVQYEWQLNFDLINVLIFEKLVFYLTETEL